LEISFVLETTINSFYSTNMLGAGAVYTTETSVASGCVYTTEACAAHRRTYTTKARAEH
jgi:hypothetical protein